jgi:fumarylacetoacetase
VIGYGVDHHGHVLFAHGERTIDLAQLPALDVDPDIWKSGSLNAFLTLGPDAWAHVYQQVQDLDPPPRAIRPRPASPRLPFAVADYVDFYSSEEHATNLGRILRPGAEPLPKAWKHLPIGYHGRSGTVIVSGESVPRPHGLLGPGDFGPTARLDVEVELGFVVGQGSTRGAPVTVDAATDRVFGVVLLNDWSARDIQGWEYQPLGPFLAKNFLTTISPWIVTPEAVAPFRVAVMPRDASDPPLFPYLSDTTDQRSGGLDIALEISILTPAMRARSLHPHIIAKSNARFLFWSPAQMVAHHASNGCALQSGDLFGSGTISGPGKGEEGSLLEMTDGGRKPITLPSGETRRFLEDGDTVFLTARASNGDVSIGFGVCEGTVIPAPASN